MDVEKFDPDNPKTFLTPQEKQKITVDRIAEALGLECIGWIQTCPGCERDTLPSDVIVKAARLQEKYSYVHPCGLKVPKFITFVIKSDENLQPYPECYMISDLIQVLERDNILASIPEQIENEKYFKSTIAIRKPKKDEFIPQVFQESKPVERFHRDFSLINVKKFIKIILKNFFFKIFIL